MESSVAKYVLLMVYGFSLPGHGAWVLLYYITIITFVLT